MLHSVVIACKYFISLNYVWAIPKHIEFCLVLIYRFSVFYVQKSECYFFLSFYAITLQFKHRAPRIVRLLDVSFLRIPSCSSRFIQETSKQCCFNIGPASRRQWYNIKTTESQVNVFIGHNLCVAIWQTNMCLFKSTKAQCASVKVRKCTGTCASTCTSA